MATITTAAATQAAETAAHVVQLLEAAHARAYALPASARQLQHHLGYALRHAKAIRDGKSVRAAD